MIPVHQTCPSRTTLQATCWVMDYNQSSAYHFQDYPWILSSLLVVPPITITSATKPTLLSQLWTLWHTVHVLLLSPYLYYQTVHQIRLKIQYLWSFKSALKTFFRKFYFWFILGGTVPTFHVTYLFINYFIYFNYYYYEKHFVSFN